MQDRFEERSQHVVETFDATAQAIETPRAADDDGRPVGGMFWGLIIGLPASLLLWSVLYTVTASLLGD